MVIRLFSLQFCIEVVLELLLRSKEQLNIHCGEVIGCIFGIPYFNTPFLSVNFTYVKFLTCK